MPDDDSREIASRLYLFIKKEKRMRKERETLVRYAKKKKSVRFRNFEEK